MPGPTTTAGSFEANPRARMVTRTWDGMDAARRDALVTRGRAVIRRL